MMRRASGARWQRRQGDIMINPLDIMPILALALMIAFIPLLADGPPGSCS
jgi:hypothetical protein